MIFDGPNRLIILEAADGNTVEAVELYSQSKDWIASGAGAPYPPPFLSSVGGDPIGIGVFAGSYFFLNTADGWAIRPREANHALIVVGNLYPDVPGTPIFAPTLGVFRITIERTVSSLTQTVATGGSSGPTPEEVADAVWEHATALQLTEAVAALLLGVAQLPSNLQEALNVVLSALRVAYPAALAGTSCAPGTPHVTPGTPPAPVVSDCPPPELPARTRFLPRAPLLGVRDRINKVFQAPVPFVSGDVVREVVYRAGVRVPYSEYQVNVAERSITFVQAPQPTDTLFIDLYVEII